MSIENVTTHYRKQLQENEIIHTEIRQNVYLFSVVVHVCIDGELLTWTYSQGGFIIKNLEGANGITGMLGAPGSGFALSGPTPALFVTPEGSGTTTLVAITFVVKNATSVTVMVYNTNGLITLPTVWNNYTSEI